MISMLTVQYERKKSEEKTVATLAFELEINGKGNNKLMDAHHNDNRLKFPTDN